MTGLLGSIPTNPGGGTSYMLGESDLDGQGARPTIREGGPSLPHRSMSIAHEEVGQAPCLSHPAEPVIRVSSQPLRSLLRFGR